MLATFLQLAGLVTVTVGAFLFGIPAGVIATGVDLIYIGLAVEMGGE